MFLWERIILLGAPIALIAFSFIGLLGKTGKFSRILLFAGALLFAWFFFRFQSQFPDFTVTEYFYPVDLNITLAILPVVWLLFSLVFAREDYIESLDRYKIGIGLGSIFGVVFIIAGYFYPLLVVQPNNDGVNSLYITSLGQWYFLYMIIVAAMIMINFESTYRASWGVYRRKIRPVILLIGILLVAILLTSSLILLSGELNRYYISFLAVILTLTVIFMSAYLRRYEAQQSGVFVRQQAIYSSVAIIVIGFYLILAGAIGKIIQIIGGDVKLFISVLGALIIFVVLLALIVSRSIKERIKGTVDRTFQGRQMDFETELAVFSEDIATILDPAELTEKILELLRDRLGIGRLYLYYTDPHQDNLQLIYPKSTESELDIKIGARGVFADWIFRHGEAMVMEDLLERLSPERDKIPEYDSLSRLEIAICLPLIAKQKLVGILFLGPKVNNERFLHQEIQFISSISHQFSLALFSARLSEELLASRQIESFHKFTAFVLHDLKNSVSMLSMLLQNYESNKDNPEFQKSAITTITGAVQRMQTVIEKLKSGAEAESFSKSDCNLKQILLSLEDKLKLTDNRKINYVNNVSDRAVVRADEEKLTEVIRNLIINALEAMPEGGDLKAETIIEADTLSLEISDTGSGMSEEFIAAKLFQPFSTTKAKGLGIGLYQSKDWLDKMGARIKVQSAPGEGTCFKIIFKTE